MNWNRLGCGRFIGCICVSRFYSILQRKCREALSCCYWSWPWRVAPPVSLSRVDAACVITEFNPANGTVVKSIQFPVVFTFSEEVSKGDGCVSFLNDFGDTTNVCTNSTGIVIDGNNATVTIPDKFFYGSTYSVFFVDTPFLSQSGEAVSLAKGLYSFVISSTPLVCNGDA